MGEKTATRADLIAEFETDDDIAFASGRSNNITDIALSIISVFGSLAATVLVSTRSPLY